MGCCMDQWGVLMNEVLYWSMLRRCTYHGYIVVLYCLVMCCIVQRCIASVFYLSTHLHCVMGVGRGGGVRIAGAIFAGSFWPVGPQVESYWILFTVKVASPSCLQSSDFCCRNGGISQFIVLRTSSCQLRSRQGKSNHVKESQGKSSQAAGQIKSRQGKASQTRQGKSSQVKASQVKSSQVKSS